jgi:glycosyltransferase involved in cell wall biosynthesis
MPTERQGMKFLLIAGLPESLTNFRGPLIAALQARGLEVHVAAPDMPAESQVRVRLESQGVGVHSIPMGRTGTNPVADARSMLAMWALMRRLKPDYVMGYTIKPVIYGSLAAYLARVPRRIALITGLGYAFQGDGQRGGLRALVQWLYGLALARVHLTFFQNPDDLALFRQSGILSEGMLTCVVNGSGVDVARFSAMPLPAKQLRFLLIARLLGDKGVREYAQAARVLKDKHPEVVCTLVGWLDSNPDAIKQSELDAWIADGRIEFLGRLSDVRPAIERCSVYVLPSYREGTPRTVLEAMAMGRPVITADAPGCRETVVDGENGFLIPVKSVTALVAAMERFVQDPELARRMGARGRQLAEEKYDVHKVNSAMLTAMGIR